MSTWTAQSRYGVRFGWGAADLQALAAPLGAAVVIDVLSFATAVDVAVSREIAVYPYHRHDASAAAYARQHEAVLAAARRGGDPETPWTLAPSALLEAPHTERLVLPSPNGATLSRQSAAGTTLTACLRNAAATAQWLRTHGYGGPERPLAAIAAGERWPDGGLRPALEDQLGAGALLHALGEPDEQWSPEARAARSLFAAATLPEELRDCVSGVELREHGFAPDVEVAAELNASESVALMQGGAFVNVGRSSA